MWVLHSVAAAGLGCRDCKVSKDFGALGVHQRVGSVLGFSEEFG